VVSASFCRSRLSLSRHSVDTLGCLAVVLRGRLASWSWVIIARWKSHRSCIILSGIVIDPRLAHPSWSMDRSSWIGGLNLSSSPALLGLSNPVLNRSIDSSCIAWDVMTATSIVYSKRCCVPLTAILVRLRTTVIILLML